MDNDVIDVSHMTEEDRREHMRRMNQLTTCPCMNCQAICDRWSTVAECDAYQEWLDRNMRPRKRRHG